MRSRIDVISVLSCGVLSCFLLNATLKYYINQYEADTGLVQNVLNSFYVDDLVTGQRAVEKCLSLYQKSKKCLSDGGFNSRQWISNSPKLLELICEDQGGPVGNCAVVEDTESYAKTTVNHLELATDLSVDVFICCLRGFAASRGLPELISSDMQKRLTLQIKF